jgi:hypothetical protein
MSQISRHLTLIGNLQRNVPAATSTGGFADDYETVHEGVPCRISQPGKQRAVIGGQAVADLNPVVLFEPDLDVRDQDRLVITGGTPVQLIDTTWEIFSPVGPSVPIYVSATGRRIATAARP